MFKITTSNKIFAPLFVAAMLAPFVGYIHQAEAQYVQDGLLGYWSFDADTIQGKTVKDVSGNNNDGEIVGASIKNVDGKVGEALKFGEFGEFVDTGLLVSPAEFDELTMMAWAKPAQKHGAWGALMAADDGGWDRGYGYRIETWEIQVGHGGDWQPGPKIEIDKWQHTAVVYIAPKEARFYLNGERFDFNQVTPTTSTNTLLIGADIACGPNCVFIGAIDEVLVYHRALSDVEIKRNFTATGLAVDSTGKLALTWGKLKMSK
ncbi:TPA: LamG domain-containing protein [Candidatus Poribacteria bacterium]|nr:LamG domain-containing protein [Candidatus Poribacteria bacterium]